MKGPIRNRISDMQHERNYQIHLRRMNEISFGGRSHPDILASHAEQQHKHRHPTQPNNRSKISRDRKVQEQNLRLMKKLNQIGKKKPSFNKQSRAEKQYYTIQQRSRRLHRDLKEKAIQEENDLLVERLVNQRKMPSPIFYQLPSQKSKAKLQSNNKRSNSVILPKLDRQNIHYDQAQNDHIPS